MIPVEAFLHIPTGYLHGVTSQRLTWSFNREALELDSGETFLFFAEVVAFVEGFAAVRPLIHFGHMLHFLYLLRHGEEPRFRSAFATLARARQRVPRLARNGGRLCAILCDSVPSLCDAPPAPVVGDWLRSFAAGRETTWDLDLSSADAEPPFTPDVFQILLALGVAERSEEQLAHFLRHGTWSLDEQGEQLAEELLTQTPPLTRWPDLATLISTPAGKRLVGAGRFIEQLISALSVPPRRLHVQELPLGGYSDITTAGPPERLLVSQFALDELELLRRFAEHELLYYRREDPCANVPREDLVLLLDQGVRTWGLPRLALVAAVFALARHAEQRKLPLRLALTSNNGYLLDPLTLSSEELATHLAASDLSTGVAPVLETLLRTSTTGPRDLVLLTHPRNLALPDTIQVLRMARTADRLFALTIDEHGAAIFHEMRPTGSVPMSRFTIDLTPEPADPEKVVEQRSTRARPGMFTPWTGDIEPIGFPFRMGTTGTPPLTLVAFDQAGEFLLFVGQWSLLFLVHTNAGTWEIPPRPMRHGRLLLDILDVIGVSGGFVLTGAIHHQFLAAHYDLATRTVRVYDFDSTPEGPTAGALPLVTTWRYLRQQHALLFSRGRIFQMVHLSTGRQEQPPAYLQWPHSPQLPRNTVALPFQEGGIPRNAGSQWRAPTLTLHHGDSPGRLALNDEVPGWHAFTPVCDGEPELQQATLIRAECRRHVLAALFDLPGLRRGLWLFQGPNGSVLTRKLLQYARDVFTLSPDGLLLAIQSGAGQLDVIEIFTGRVRLTTPVGRFHNNVRVELGASWLALMLGNMVHVIKWQGGRLVAEVHQGLHPNDLETRVPNPETAIVARAGRLPGFLAYDPARFRLAAWSNLIAVVTGCGEVFLFDHREQPIAAFFAFRHFLGGWLPDGTTFGAEELTGQPQTQGADWRFGQALEQAWVAGEGTIT